jgi:hypothetical protein
MSTICDKCNRPTRTIYPYVREAATIAEAFDPNRILPRSAWLSSPRPLPR